MLLQFLYIMGILKGIGGKVSGGLESDSVRVGTPIISSLLRPGGTKILLSLFNRLSHGKMGSTADIVGEIRMKELVPAALGLLGVDSAKLKNFALDGFISLIYMMNEVMTEKRRNERSQKRPENFFPFLFIFNQPHVVKLLELMEDPSIVDQLLKESQERLKDRDPEDVECIQLLICKTKPFIGGMQKSLNFFARREKMASFSGKASGNFSSECGGRDSCQEDASWEKAGLEDRLYYFVPNLEEVVENGDRCDERFPKCIY